MHLRSLELLSWRNFDHARVNLGPGLHVLTGDNGQGKTNILEAIHYLALGRSHRTADEHALIHVKANDCLIRADMGDDQQRHHVEMALSRSERNRARLDGVQRPRHDVLGRLRVVMFAPEDLVLVRGDPADRRRFLDEVLGQRRPEYRRVRHEYERVLRQRNALLRDLRHGIMRDVSALSTWSEELIRLGSRITAARLMACAALGDPAATCYAHLVGQDQHEPDLRLTLERSTGHDDAISPAEEPDIGVISEQLRHALRQRQQDEQERGMSLVGPHRDDVRIHLGGLPVKNHASQGEAWSVALALRLGSRELLRTSDGFPIVLLDDVFAQLDDDRRRRLAAWCQSCEQALITAAVPRDVPVTAHHLHVDGGSVMSTNRVAEPL